jgi:hypothetical protein
MVVLMLSPLALLVFVMVFAVPQWLRARASRSWPSVDGRITFAHAVRGRGANTRPLLLPGYTGALILALLIARALRHH